MAQGIVSRQRPATSAAKEANPKQLALTEDDIRARAYELYLQRGTAPGSELDDWLRAEKQLKGN